MNCRESRKASRRPRSNEYLFYRHSGVKTIVDFLYLSPCIALHLHYALKWMDGIGWIQNLETIVTPNLVKAWRLMGAPRDWGHTDTVRYAIHNSRVHELINLDHSVVLNSNGRESPRDIAGSCFGGVLVLVC